mmetsp:Transcript_22735/g.71194  ORF Transcript_22735/g.71194 Transcript_22735/m.71194 type:complete len:269 (+) Transcript_22735:821-1627(+)
MTMRSAPPASSDLAEMPVPAPAPTIGTPRATMACSPGRMAPRGVEGSRSAGRVGSTAAVSEGAAEEEVNAGVEGAAASERPPTLSKAATAAAAKAGSLMCSGRRSTVTWPLPEAMSSRSSVPRHAPVASGSKKGMPSASSIETPFSGRSTRTGRVALASLSAMKRATASFSSLVVRMSVTSSLCTNRSLSLYLAGTVALAPKLTMSTAPTDTTRGTPAATAASRRLGPPDMTPPTTSSATSVVVRSSTPPTSPDETSPSMALPPVPVA